MNKRARTKERTKRALEERTVEINGIPGGKGAGRGKRKKERKRSNKGDELKGGAAGRAGTRKVGGEQKRGVQAHTYKRKH